MGLLTLLLVAAFSLFYLSGAIPNKPPFLEKTLAVIKENLNYLAMGGLIFGFVALLITPLMMRWPLDIFSRVFADFLLILMALPYAFEKLIAPQQAKINGAIMNEIKRLMAWITSHATYFGAAGVVASILLFATVFR